jgi:integrase
MMCYLFKRGRFYQGKVRLDSWAKERTFSLHTTDRRVAQSKLEKTLQEFEMEAAGLVAPRTARQAAQRPIAELQAAFLGDLTARGKSSNTLRIYRAALGKLRAGCGWNYLRDVTGESFCAWRAGCGLSPKTANDYLHAGQRFFRWLMRQRMAVENPLEYVEPVEARTVAEYRRALTASEVALLLATAPRARAIVYRLAVETGIRRRELKGLRWADMNLECERPCVRVPASIAKNRKTVLIELGPEMVAELRILRTSDTAAFQPVFTALPKLATLQRDLAEAGIPFVDDLGRRADFHALRKTLGTTLAVQGVHPYVLKEVMRHSDLKLTMKVYMDAGQLPVSAALAKLPWQKLQRGNGASDGRAIVA